MAATTTTATETQALSPADVQEQPVSRRPELPPNTYRPGAETAGAQPSGVPDAADPGQPPSQDRSSRPRLRRGRPQHEAGGAAPLTCIVMGPGQVGKTTLIASMDQACHTSKTGDTCPVLSFVGGTGMEYLTRQASRTITENGQNIGHTDREQRYEFTITATSHGDFWKAPQRAGAHFAVIDGPGGALFPTTNDRSSVGPLEWERELIQRAQGADLIVLCLDPTDSEHCGLAYEYVPGLLAQIAIPQVEKPQPRPVGQRLLEQLGLAAPQAPVAVRRLRARRFLLLLTKVDKLVGPVHRQGRRGFLAGRRPLDVALRVDPAAQASALVGLPVLRRIQSALSPDAKLAVGIASAWGFDRITGQPFMTSGGDRPLMLSGMDRTRRPVEWWPFGVRESLLFLLTGRAEGPVHIVERPAATR